MPESTSVRKLKVRPANPVGKGSVWTGRIEATSKVVGILGALVAAYIGLEQYRRAVDQSVREFDWKRAEQSRAAVDALLKDEAWDAMLMLDWTEGRIYELPSKRRVKIVPSEVPVALRRAICPTTIKSRSKRSPMKR